MYNAMGMWLKCIYNAMGMWLKCIYNAMGMWLKCIYNAMGMLGLGLGLVCYVVKRELFELLDVFVSDRNFTLGLAY